MSLLPERYWLAGILKIGAFARAIDGACSDYVFLHSTTGLTWADVRFAREHKYDLTEPSGIQMMRAHQKRSAQS